MDEPIAEPVAPEPRLENVMSAGRPGQRGLILLLVEDDEGDAILVEDQLALSLPGAHLHQARTLEAALPMLSSVIDCILLDLRLPDSGGIDAVQAVRSRSPGTPLIVLTGLADESAGIAALDAGAQDYLIKGNVDGDALARAIRYAISRRQADEAERQLLLAQTQAQEASRLERGLTPEPMIGDSLAWVASCYRPGRRRALLGGDFFDVVETVDGTLRILVGDVCGHGTDEAAIGVCLRSGWRTLALTSSALADVMLPLQETFEHERHHPDLFVTLCCVEIEANSRQARLIQAGHAAPILIDGQSVAPLDRGVGGAPIGVGDTSWPERTLELGSDWAVLLYTDGITDGRVDGGMDRLGEAGLHDAVSDAVQRNPQWRGEGRVLLEDLLTQAESLNDGPLSDDVAMLLVGRRDGSAGQ
jgi:serine phosphatase RsbU (regulator of sigma subunit)